MTSEQQSSASTSNSILKSAFQGSLLYMIPVVGQRLASILLLPVITRVLTPGDFGMLSLLDQVGAVLGILLCGSFSSALGYFYFENESKENRETVVGTTIIGAYLLGAAGALVGAVFMGPIANHIFDSKDALLYLPLVLMTMPLDFGWEAFTAWLRVEDRQSACVKMGLLRIGLTVSGIGVLVGILKLHVIAYVTTNLFTGAVLAIILITYWLRSMRVRLSLGMFGRMFRFSFPVALTLVALFIMNFGDQFILRRYRSLADVGIYSFAYRIGMLVSMVYGSFHMYWTAQVYHILKRDDGQSLFARLTTYVVTMLAFVTICLSLGSKPGLHILVAPQFRSAAALIPIIAAANALRSFGEFVRCRFLAAGRPGYRAYCDWAGMAVCMMLYFILIPRYGMWGAAWATISTFIFLAILSLIATYRLNPYRVEGRRLLKLGAVTATIMVLYYCLPVSSLFLQLAWSSFLLALFPVGLWLLGFPTEGEKARALSVIVSLRTKAVDALAG